MLRWGGMAKAVFLDRDGTLNVDPGYLNDPSDVRLLPGVLEGMGILHRAGFIFVVVTNQSGLSRGKVQARNLQQIHDRIQELLKPSGARIARFEICPHHPDEDCECRKPRSKLILDSIDKLKIDPQASYMVGDRKSDLQAGRSAGLGGVALVRTGVGSQEERELKSEESDFIGDTLEEVARWIVERD